MNPDRDFLYLREIVSFKVFVSDDRRLGLHLVQRDGDTVDVVFAHEALSELRTLPTLLQELLSRGN